MTAIITHTVDFIIKFVQDKVTRQGKLHDLTFHVKLTLSHEVILKHVIICISNQNIDLNACHCNTNALCTITAVYVVNVYLKIM